MKAIRPVKLYYGVRQVVADMGLVDLELEYLIILHCCLGSG